MNRANILSISIYNANQRESLLRTHQDNWWRLPCYYAEQPFKQARQRASRLRSDQDVWWKLRCFYAEQPFQQTRQYLWSIFLLLKPGASDEQVDGGRRWWCQPINHRCWRDQSSACTEIINYRDSRLEQLASSSQDKTFVGIASICSCVNAINNTSL